MKISILTERRIACAFWMLGAAALVPTVGAQPTATTSSQAYPTKPIRLIVPFPPGGAVDAIARIVGGKMSESFSHNVVIDNRGGAGGALGSEIAAKSPADGYTTLLGSSSSISINPFLNSKLQYDPKRDFAPISLIGFVPHILLVHPSVPATSVKDFIAYAKGQAKPITFASAGIGTSHHLSGEIFKTMTGLNMIHVPYAGSGPAIVGLMGGHVQFLSLDVPAALPQVKAGKVRALGIATLKRDPLLPDLPTVSESGLPGFEVTAWYGLFAPSKTPGPAIARLSSEVARALAATDSREALAKIGVTVQAMSGEEFVKFLQREDVKWAKAVKDSGAKLE